MKNTRQKYTFIKWTSKISPNVIDWFRSIYFSLFGSSMLTFGLKYSTLSTSSLIIFAAGVFSFLLGLLVSVSIANRFKQHEKNYDRLQESTKLAKEPGIYYSEQEIDTKYKLLRNIEHFSFYTLWIPAITCIGLAGFYMETNLSKNNRETKERFQSIIPKVQAIDSTLKIIIDKDKDKKLFQDSLNLTKNIVWKQEKQIDSLKKRIITIRQKQKNKENENNN